MLTKREVKEAESVVAKAARSNMTEAEIEVWDMVRAHRLAGLSWRRQTVIGPFRVDFYCPSAKLVVEVDGGVHDEPEIAKRDADRQQILENDFHLNILRLTNDEVLTNPQTVRQKILTAAAKPPEN